MWTAEARLSLGRASESLVAEFHGLEEWLLYIPAINISHPGSRRSSLCCIYDTSRKGKAFFPDWRQEGKTAMCLWAQMPRSSLTLVPWLGSLGFPTIGDPSPPEAAGGL